MSEFKVGEVAILCGYKRCPEMNGREITIASPAHFAVAEKVSTGERNFVYGYNINGAEDFGINFAQPHHLQKKRPPEEPASWDRVADVTGWNPAGVPA